MNNNYQRKMSYDIINDEYISDEDYKHAKTVWNGLNLKMKGDCYASEGPKSKKLEQIIIALITNPHA